MANITLITVGTLKENYLKDAVSEYKKRLSQYARVDEINIKEERIVNEDDSSEVRRALDSEGEKILAAIPKGSIKIALCVEGKQLSSEAFAEKIDKAAASHSEIIFIIGSSHGLSDSVKSACDARLSISEMTFPHQLMRVIMAEAIYRALNILKGTKYHK